MILLARSQGANRGRLLRRCVSGEVVPTVCTALLAVAMSSTLASELSGASASVPRPSPAGAACIEQSRTHWPDGLTARRARIADLQRLRHLCIDDAAFLALLGALLLEDGDAEQALVWLERSLLLDPDSLGARVDHALALAALGQPGPLQEIADALRHRADVPPPLRARLYPSDQRSVFAWPAVRLGHALRPDWGAQGEISLLTGHEGNLDRSPRLSELALTLPDGVLVLPVESQPRSGVASLGAAAVQLAYAPQAATVLRTGFILAARAASSQRATDWHQWQWAAGASHDHNGLRSQLDLSVGGIGGPLGEPYALRRLGLSVEAQLQICRVRFTLEREQRVQSRTASLDSRTDAWLASMQCPLPAGQGWRWMLDLRAGRDEPDSPERPGGLQRTRGAGLRLVGAAWREALLEIGLRTGTARDALGYSPLLDNNAPRRMALHQLSVEMALPLHRVDTQRLEAIIKWQAAYQSSNLPLFRYRANSAYAGVRWLW